MSVLLIAVAVAGSRGPEFGPVCVGKYFGRQLLRLSGGDAPVAARQHVKRLGNFFNDVPIDYEIARGKARQ